MELWPSSGSCKNVSLTRPKQSADGSHSTLQALSFLVSCIWRHAGNTLSSRMMAEKGGDERAWRLLLNIPINAKLFFFCSLCNGPRLKGMFCAKTIHFHESQWSYVIRPPCCCFQYASNGGLSLRCERWRTDASVQMCTVCDAHRGSPKCDRCVCRSQRVRSANQPRERRLILKHIWGPVAQTKRPNQD